MIFSGEARQAVSGTGSILSDGVGSVTYDITGTSSVTNTKIEVDGGVRLTFQGAESIYDVSSNVVAGALIVGIGTQVTFTGEVNQYSEGGTSLTILKDAVANFTYDNGTGNYTMQVDYLYGAGTLNAKNLNVNHYDAAVDSGSGKINIEVTETVTFAVDSTVASIKAGSIIAKSLNVTNSLTATNVTLSGSNSVSAIGVFTTENLTLSNSSALNVAGVLTATSITVNGSTGASITTPLISTGSIAAASLTITLTEAALASMNFDVDGKFTLIDLDAVYSGAYIFDIKNVSALSADFAYDELFWVANNSYTISKNTVEGEKIIITEVDRIPEPSTATLSLLALAGLLARRRRKQG